MKNSINNFIEEFKKYYLDSQFNWIYTENNIELIRFKVHDIEN